MNAADRFVEEYRKAEGNKPASRLLTEAARRYILVAKGMGVRQHEVVAPLTSLRRALADALPKLHGSTMI